MFFIHNQNYSKSHLINIQGYTENQAPTLFVCIFPNTQRSVWGGSQNEMCLFIWHKTALIYFCMLYAFPLLLCYCAKVEKLWRMLISFMCVLFWLRNGANNTLFSWKTMHYTLQILHTCSTVTSGITLHRRVDCRLAVQYSRYPVACQLTGYAAWRVIVCSGSYNAQLDVVNLIIQAFVLLKWLHWKIVLLTH